MSMKLNAGDVGRSDEFLIDPQEILVDDALNGRWNKQWARHRRLDHDPCSYSGNLLLFRQPLRFLCDSRTQNCMCSPINERPAIQDFLHCLFLGVNIGLKLRRRAIIARRRFCVAFMPDGLHVGVGDFFSNR